MTLRRQPRSGRERWFTFEFNDQGVERYSQCVRKFSAPGSRTYSQNCTQLGSVELGQPVPPLQVFVSLSEDVDEIEERFFRKESEGT